MKEQGRESLSSKDEWDIAQSARTTRHMEGYDPLGPRDYTAELARLKITPLSKMTPAQRVQLKLRLGASIG